MNPRSRSSQTPRPFLVGMFSLMVGALAGVAPAARGATFTWAQACGGGLWYENCQSGHCVSEEGPIRIFNNWGHTSCGEGSVPPAPGPGDSAIVPAGGTAYLPEGAGIINVTVDGQLTLGNSLGSLVETGLMQVNGGLIFNGGRVSGPFQIVIAAGATAATTYGSGELKQGTLTNHGTFSMAGDQTALVVREGARLYNEGLIEISANTTWGSGLEGFSDNPANALYNNGTIRKTNSAGFQVQGMSVYHTGTLEVQNGIFGIAGPGTSSGAFNIFPGATVQLFSSGSSFSLNVGTTFTNSGLLYQGNGTLSIPGNMSVPNLEVSSGDLSNGGVLTCPIALRVRNGNLFGAGSILVPLGGEMFIDGGFNFHDHLVNNYGVLHWTNGGFADVWESGFELNNYGTWDENGAYTFGPGMIRNFGTMNARHSQIGGGNFENSGLVEVQAGNVTIDHYVQTAGTTRLLPGGTNLAGDGGITLNGGILEGAGGTAVLKNMGGIVSPGLPIGQIASAGLEQSAAGTLRIELGGTAPGQYDVLGATYAQLDGTLEVGLANGYMPRAGDTFVIITHGVRTGQFATLTAPPTCTGQPLFQVVYNQNDVSLVVTSAACANAAGDLNGSGECDAGDVPGLINALMSGGAYDPCADVNHDCLHDGRDVQAFVHCMGN